MYKKINRNHFGCTKILFSVLLLLSHWAGAQQASQGNTTVFNGAQLTFFGAHTFVAGGSGTQPGIIKTIRTAPFGILSYYAGAGHSGATDANHVDGYVGKYGTTAFTFPVGNGTKLRPVSISAPVSGAFKAAYWFSNPNTATLPAGAPFLVANLGTGVTAVSNVEYWDVDGPSAINLTLSWDAASALSTLTGGVIANLVIVGYNTSTNKWESLGNAGGTTGTLATTGTVTANGVTPDTYSAFTFGTASVVTPDLTITMDIDALSFPAAGSSKDFVINLYEINGLDATNPIVFFISKLSAFTITYPTTSGSSNVFGGSLNENSNWSITENSNFITVTAKTGVIIPGNGQAVIGFNIARKTGISAGTTQNITATITGGSAGEVNIANNAVITSVSATAN